MKKIAVRIASVIVAVNLFNVNSQADSRSVAAQYLRESSNYYKSKQYFKSARYAFAAAEADSTVKSEAYSWITMGLVHAGMPHAATYFFIRTLQTGSSASIRSVLTQTQELFMAV